MDMQAGVDSGERYAFNRTFVKDWVLARKFGRQTSDQRQRWHDRMVRKMEGQTPGRELAVERRVGLTPEQFRRDYFVPGKPVVLDGAGRQWPAVKKWTFEFLMERCGQDRIDVLDGHNWRVSRREGDDVVSTTERGMQVKELLAAARTGSEWYGAFMELLDKYDDLRQDIDLDFVRRYGSMDGRVPWQQNTLAKMYVGGPMTATSLHCAPVMNLYLQAYGRKRWVLIAPGFSPFMYMGLSKGLNWQSRVDFRNPDYTECPLYQYVDRYETVLEPGDVLWNPPWVWHGVQNLTESIAVSMWWFNVTRSFANNPVLTPLVMFLGEPNPIMLQLGLHKDTAEKASAFSVHLNK